MFDWLRKILWGGRDDVRRHETSFNEKARMLEMDEPMAGAGALLAAEPDNSETEKALKRAAEKRLS